MPGDPSRQRLEGYTMNAKGEPTEPGERIPSGKVIACVIPYRMVELIMCARVVPIWNELISTVG